jgi:hypothetical protein
MLAENEKEEIVMKLYNTLKIIVIFGIFQTSLIHSQNLDSLTLIAHYPLYSTANDTTGNYDPMILTNTPFQEGGIYCNGNYIWGDPDPCDAITPDITDFNFESFAVSAMFKVKSIPTRRRPVFVCGRDYKWLCTFVDPDSTVGLGHSSLFFTAQSSREKFTIDQWHKVTVTYDSTEGVGRLFFNEVLADSAIFQNNHHNDRTFTITEGGNGVTFKGFLKDLKIFSKFNLDLRQDSLALVELYNSTDGANWTNNENWLTGPVSTWYGITVTNDRVTKVKLSNNNMAGIVPSKLGNLTELTILSLNGNQLTGPIPEEMGNLSLLTCLQLTSNQLTGTIPVSFGYLTNLSILELGYNQLTGFIPNEIGNLNQLIRFMVNDNNLSGTIPDKIFNLTGLTALRLENNGFEGAIPIEITNLTALELIWLHKNKFIDIPDLSSITTLTDFRIQDNRFTFEDIEPNITVPTFIYSPQDSVETKLDTTISQGTRLELTVSVGGTSNQYQWTKDGADIPGADSSYYVIDPVVSSNSGSYGCRITNKIATDLTLFRRPVNVTVGGTDVKKDQIATPKIFRLKQNYPNPFNPRTAITFDLPKLCFVTLRIYNLLGKEIETLINSYLQPGEHQITWSAKDLPSGMYLYRLEAGDFIETKKLILQK